MITVRASSLSGYSDCPRRAAARMFRDMIAGAGYELRQIPNGIGAAIGTAVHSAVAVMMGEKAASGHLPPTSVSNDAVAESLQGSLKEGVMYDRESPNASDSEKQALRMAGAYRQAVAPEVSPILIEERFEAQASELLVLSGQLDLTARENGALRDLKTGKRLGHHMEQLGGYALLCRAHGHDIKSLKTDWVPRVAASKEQPDPVSYEYDLAHAEVAASAVLRHIEGDLTAFMKGDGRGLMAGDRWAFASNPSSMLCSYKWCPAWGTDFCKEHKGV